MNSDLRVIIDITEKEYHSGSFNGPSLRTMLDGLTLEEVTSTDTYEGYSVWGIVLHLLNWKYELAAWLDAPGLPDYPYPKANWPALPENPSQEAWNETLAVMDVVHAAYIAALRDLPPGKLEEKMESWGCAWAEGITWMATHDTYHIAQIRNMGLKHFAERE
jgi:hypothetical protein